MLLEKNVTLDRANRPTQIFGLQGGKKKMPKYYLVKGFNAVAIVPSWNQAQKIQKYFKGVNFKGYDTYDAANEAGLQHLAKITPSYIQLPEFLILGKVVAVSSLNKDFLASGGKEKSEIE